MNITRTNYSKIENLEIIEKIIPLIDECPELIWETDYPAIPIGGENPYYMCKYCNKTNVEISVDRGKHYNNCEWIDVKNKYDNLISQLNEYEKNNLDDIINDDNKNRNIYANSGIFLRLDKFGTAFIYDYLKDKYKFSEEDIEDIDPNILYDFEEEIRKDWIKKRNKRQ